MKFCKAFIKLYSLFLWIKFQSFFFLNKIPILLYHHLSIH
jgi:hypothetical protein